MVTVSSLVLFATDLGATTAFYRAVGLPLEDEDHGEGPAHAAAELGDVHFAIYPAGERLGARAPAWRSASSDFPGFYVDSLDEVLGALTTLGAAVRESHQVRPWGCRILAEDPDGRTVEINQQGHCPDASQTEPG
jgi:predicted enzyme related to lactoylglutathione lyase